MIRYHIKVLYFKGVFYSLDPKTPGPHTPGPQDPDPKTPEVNVNNFHYAIFYITVLEDG